MTDSELEVMAMRDRFDVVVEKWQLSSDEAAAVLGEAGDYAKVVYSEMSVRSETSMRLMIELDQLLSLMMSAEEIAAWARSAPDTGPDPIAFMGLGLTHLRALVHAARLRIQEGRLDLN